MLFQYELFRLIESFELMIERNRFHLRMHTGAVIDDKEFAFFSRFSRFLGLEYIQSVGSAILTAGTVIPSLGLYSQEQKFALEDFRRLICLCRIYDDFDRIGFGRIVSVARLGAFEVCSYLVRTVVVDIAPEEFFESADNSVHIRQCIVEFNTFEADASVAAVHFHGHHLQSYRAVRLATDLFTHGLEFIDRGGESVELDRSALPFGVVGMVDLTGNLHIEGD